MSESARIHDFRALSDAKAALIKFVDEATAALASMDADVQRMSQWLSSDRPSHWKAEIRRREDAVNAAKAEIAKKQLSRAPEPASVVQERKALERAKLRLEDAQRRAENVRKWAPRWEREAMMYKGACQALSEALHRDIPLACARLDAMRNTLEAYARMAPPSESGGGSVTAPSAPEPELSERLKQGERP
ncbi:MAG: hypothetical protein JSR77_07500 [Planctomycetes bacterium]|nr:hypothetical protein [Planctomycetota bacterium]